MDYGLLPRGFPGAWPAKTTFRKWFPKGVACKNHFSKVVSPRGFPLCESGFSRASQGNGQQKPLFESGFSRVPNPPLPPPPVQLGNKMHVDCWIQQVTTRVGAVTCWIQQSVSPKQVVGFSCLFNSEVDQLISKARVVVSGPAPFNSAVKEMLSQSRIDPEAITILIAPLLTFLIQNRSFVRSFFRSFVRSFCQFLRPPPPRRGPCCSRNFF